MCMEIAQIKQDLENFQCPKWQQLPDFDVYMDQVIFFINDRLSPLFFLEDKADKVITSNMVNCCLYFKKMFFIDRNTNHD